MYDAIVIGGGPGGYTCAIRVAQLGGSVCLVEKNGLGELVPNEDVFLLNIFILLEISSEEQRAQRRMD
jgi:thioredoxin reductase